MFFIVSFKQNNALATGLSPSIDIWEVDGTNLDVNDGAMTELGSSGIYFYDFSGSYDDTKTYTAMADGGVTLSDRYVAPTCIFRDYEEDLEIIDGKVSNIAIGSSGISVKAESATITKGSQTLTYEATQERDGSLHEIADDGGEIDLYYQFDVGAVGVPSSVTFYGRVFNSSDNINVYGYNWGETSWEQIGTIEGINQTINEELTFSMYNTHVGTGANAGKARVKFQNTGLTSAVLRVDQLYVSYANVQSAIGYANGAIWVDTINGTAGTVVGVNGVADLPVLTWADALTISASAGLTRFHIISGSTITLSDNSDNFEFLGWEWTLDLNGKSIAGCYINGAAVTGTSAGAGARFFFCKIAQGGAASLTSCGMKECAIAGSITLLSAGTYFMDGCFSGIAGTSTPDIDFGAALGNTQLNMRHYSGGIEIKNIGTNGTDDMSLEGDGQLILNANCAGGTIAIRGHFTITDNVGGGFSGTLSNDAMFDHNTIIDDILVDVTGLNGEAMRGTDSAALASVCTEARLVQLTGENMPATLNDVASSTSGLNGEAMRGTDGANTTVPDAAGTAATLIAALNNLSSAQANAACDQAIADAALATATALGIVDSNIDVLITRLTEARAGYLDNLSAGAVAVEATLIAMKGAGWSDETLKAIKDAVDSISAADATIAKQNDIIDKLKGLMSKDYSLITPVGSFDPVKESNEAIRDRGDLAWTSDQIQGSNAITITVQDGDANNIVECAVEIWDSAGTTFYEKADTNASGQTVHNLDDGTYTIKMHKAEYSFDEQTLVVTAVAEVTYTGTAFNPGTPVSPEDCRVFEYCFEPGGLIPITDEFRAIAKIISLPYDSGGVLHAGSEVIGTYSSITGLLYFDLVQGAEVAFDIPLLGVKYTRTISAVPSKRLSDLT